MKKRDLTRALCLLLGTLLLLTLPACTKQPTYADDVSCEELMTAALAQIPTDLGYETLESDHLRYYFEDTDLPNDFQICYSIRSEDINEIGIFHTTDVNAQKELLALAEKYLAVLREEQRAFIASYAAEELPKLDRAEVQSFGNYTVYAILNDNDRARVFEAIEERLVPK